MSTATSATASTETAALPRFDVWVRIETAAAWLFGIVWIAPLLYAVWAAIHPTGYATTFDLFAPLTLENFATAWISAPFARYFLNTFILVTMILVAQFVLCTLAAFVFARADFPGSGILFALVLIQLMITPDVLLVENYRTMSALGLVDTILAIGLPYMASAFGIFLLRQTFKQVPLELEEAARVEGCGTTAILLRVYVPLAKPTMLAFGLVQMTCGLVCLAVLPALVGVWGYVLSLMLLTPGFQLFLAANNSTIMIAASEDERGMISGLLGLSRNLGFMTGASVMGAVFALAAGTRDIARATADTVGGAFMVTFLLAAGLTTLAIVLSVIDRWSSDLRDARVGPI
mgnify:CR=1 FL=1